ncbi:hypothetical protein M3610_21540 [Neobacillus sp. MER 74]|uniref:hypothetical protein n=1 Tax=Bacillaceae TaxID=186817 RepID=UPI000BF4C9C3|nr:MULTISPECIES: hypothetical protein [Bacillaceae]MCM3117840.1 hypothetical protein [Neobacillus sp. MER 74]PFP29290.1 hypothetical protein COJ96_11555 [Bacillus sp. AFS073361]
MNRNRNKNVQLTIVILVCLLAILIVHALLNIRIYFVYSTGLGPIFLIGLILFLIALLYFKG